jgi:hypothetical protein
MVALSQPPTCPLRHGKPFDSFDAAREAVEEATFGWSRAFGAPRAFGLRRSILPLQQAVGAQEIDGGRPGTGGEMTSSLAKEGVSVAPARATPTACLQELYE